MVGKQHKVDHHGNRKDQQRNFFTFQQLEKKTESRKRQRKGDTFEGMFLWTYFFLLTIHSLVGPLPPKEHKQSQAKYSTHEYINLTLPSINHDNVLELFSVLIQVYLSSSLKYSKEYLILKNYRMNSSMKKVIL